MQEAKSDLRYNNNYISIVEHNGDIYFTAESKIYKVNKSNYLVKENIAGAGEGFRNGGLLSSVRFDHPLALALTNSGDLIIADSRNHCIRMISFNDRKTTTIAGRAGYCGFKDSNESYQAQFSFPTSVAIDSHGNIIVCDSLNNRIRKLIVTDNTQYYVSKVETIAGNEAGYVDGNCSVAQFNSPWDLTIDKYDNIYIADISNNAIRKIINCSEVITIYTLQQPSSIFYCMNDKKLLIVSKRSLYELSIKHKLTEDYATVIQLTSFSAKSIQISTHTFMIHYSLSSVRCPALQNLINY